MSASKFDSRVWPPFLTVAKLNTNTLKMIQKSKVNKEVTEMLEGLVILPSSVIFIIQGFGHQLSLANWSLFFKEGEDPYKPETWRYMPLWRRMIIQSIVYSLFLFLALRCGENPISHLTLVGWTGVSYLLCLGAHWGIYPANKLLIDNALTFRAQSGTPIKINRYLFILPVLLAFAVLSLLGIQIPDSCYR